MRITSAVKNKKNPDIIRIFIDDEYDFSMLFEDYISMGLYDKEEISEEERKRIVEEVNVRAAKNQALRYLARKDCTAGEVIEKLSNAGFENAAAEQAVNDIKSMGYINDRMYAHKYISDRLKLKPKSKRALFYELQSKGIDRNIIEEAIEDIEIDDNTVAYRIAKKRFSKYDIKDIKVQRKIYSFLAHRGFDTETISKVISQL